MPTILRFRGFLIGIWFNDHPPAHVHTRKGQDFVVFDLNCDGTPVTMRDAHGLKLRRLLQSGDSCRRIAIFFVKRGGTIMVTDEEVLAAEARFEEKRRRVPFAKAVHFDPVEREIVVELNRGYSISFSPERAQGLGGATTESLSEIEISSGGYGIHFPKLDADFSVEGFLKGKFGTDHWEREWVETQRERRAA